MYAHCVLKIQQINLFESWPILGLYLIFSHFVTPLTGILIMGQGGNLSSFRFLIWQIKNSSSSSLMAKIISGAFGPIRGPIGSLTSLGLCLPYERHFPTPLTDNLIFAISKIGNLECQSMEWENVVHRVNRSPKLVRLTMGLLIGPNAAPWNDFCHIKTLKFPPSPIIRMPVNGV